MGDILTTTATVSTIPVGSKIALDDCTTDGVAQIVKLAISTDGAATLIPADATNGIDVDVTRLPALPAGNNNIGDVDIASALPAGTNAIGKLAANSGVDIGDVDVTTVTPGTTATALGKAEDAAHTSGDVGVMALAVQQTADAAFAGTTGDYAPLQVDATGYLKVNVKAGSAAGTQYNTNVAYADANTGTMALGVRDDALTTLTEADGDFTALRTDSTGALWITAASKLQTIGGDVHDAAITEANTPPVRVGAKATTSLSGLTMVAAADATSLFSGIDGVLITRPHCNLEDIVSGVDTDTAGDSTAAISAQGAGIKVYVTSVVVKNTHASTDAYVDIRDGAAGTVKATLPAPAAGGGTYTFPVPIPFSANTAVCVDPSAAVTTIITTVIGFKSKV